MEDICNFVSGELRPPSSGRYVENFEPATGRAYSRVPDSDQEDLNEAIAAAQAAFPGWSETPAMERSKVMTRIAERIEAKSDELVRAESIDTGKPLAAAKDLAAFFLGLLDATEHLGHVPPRKPRHRTPWLRPTGRRPGACECAPRTPHETFRRRARSSTSTDSMCRR